VNDRVMRQAAPWPAELEDLVERARWTIADWTFRLVDDLDRSQGSEGLTLEIGITCDDAYHAGRSRSVVHYFAVPPASYNRRTWQRWLFDQCVEVQTHEAMEGFTIDDEHPFAPHHGPGNDPYTVFEHGDDVDVRTSYRGEVKPTTH
jgi:hypothetical protein